MYLSPPQRDCTWYLTTVDVPSERSSARPWLPPPPGLREGGSSLRHHWFLRQGKLQEQGNSYILGKIKA